MADDSLHVADLVGDFARSLKAARKSPKTIRAYSDAAKRYDAWAAENSDEHPAAQSVEHATRGDVESFVVSILEEGHTPATAAAYYRHLQQFWRWVVDEGEREASPMAGMKPPKAEQRPIPIFSDADLDALMATCSGKTSADRRDAALIRMFRATGVRLAEMAGLDVESVDLDGQAILVIGKGDKARWITYSDKAASALDRWLRERRRHPQREHPALWLGQRGRLTTSGITQMLRRRGKEAGVPDVHPHRFRHTTAHRAKVAGLAESDLMEVFGWSSPEMAARYGASAKAERARAAFKRLDID